MRGCRPAGGPAKLIRRDGGRYSGGRTELLALCAELVFFNHHADGLMRSPHHAAAYYQFEPAAVFKHCRPTHCYIHPRPWRRCLRTPQTQSSAADIQGLGADRLVAPVRLEDGVTGFPPKWKSSRSAALIVHVLIMRHRP